MVSDLNQISRLKPYQSDSRAEQADTRAEIRHHEPDYDPHKQKKDRDPAGYEMFGEDQTEVSLESLSSFLQLLLNNYGRDKSGSSPQGAKAGKDEGAAAPCAKAAGAYARTAQFGEPVASPPAEEAEDASGQTEDSALSSHEIQTIHRLQKEIAALRDKGTASIRIQKAGTFLESVEDALQGALKEE